MEVNRILAQNYGTGTPSGFEYGFNLQKELLQCYLDTYLNNLIRNVSEEVAVSKSKVTRKL